MTTRYEDIILSHSPVLFLPLNEVAGDTATALAGSNGTYTGPPTLGVVGPTQVGSTGIATDGVNDYMEVEVPGAALGVSQAQSWELWANNSVNITSATSSIILQGSRYANTSVESFALGSSTGVLTNEVVTVLASTGATSYRTGWRDIGTITAGWHHYVFTYNGIRNGWKCYIDGANIEGPPWNGTIITSSGGSAGFVEGTILLGANESDNNDTVGSGGWFAWAGFAGHAVYDYELTATQVLQHYNASPLAFKGVNEAQAKEKGAVLHLPLDDFGGTVARATVGQNGTYVGSPTKRVAGPSLSLPHATTYNGTNQYVTLGDVLDYALTGSYSISMWVSWTETGSLRAVVGKGAGTLLLYSNYKIGGTTSGWMLWYTGTGVDANALEFFVGVPDGKWHHVTIVRNGTTQTAYVDGVQAATRTEVTPPAASATALTIAGPINSNYFKGSISDFSIYDRALTAAEVYDLYAQGLSTGRFSYNNPIEYNPLLHLPLDDVSGTTAVATVGPNGTYVGSPTLQAQGPSGVLPVAAQFNGSTQNVTAYIEAPSDFYSYEMWVYIDALPKSGAFFKHGNTSSVGTQGFGLGIGNGSVFETAGSRLMALYEGVAWYNSGYDMTPGWHHVALHINVTGTAISFFVDGEIVNSQSTLSPIGPIGHLAVGGYNNGTNRYFNGRIAAFSFYASQLTVDQIRDRYLTSKQQFIGNADGPITY